METNVSESSSVQQESTLEVNAELSGGNKETNVAADDPKPSTSKLSEHGKQSDVEDDDDDDFSDLPELIDAKELEEDKASKKDENKEHVKKLKTNESELDADGYFDILDNRQLLKKVLKEGNKDVPRPERGNKVCIKITTKLKDSDEEIKSHSHERFEMFIGDYDTIHGLDLLIPLMHVNEISEILIAPRFAYGEQGLEPDIPANATLKCVVELLSFDYIDDIVNLPLEERYKFGSMKKERGNFWLKREDFSIAGQCYKRSIEFLDVQEEEMRDYNESNLDEGKNKLIKSVLEQRTAAYNNLSIVHMKQENYDHALKAVNSALMHDEKNIKALYRKAKILSALGEYSDAIDVLRNSLKLNVEEKLIQNELNKLIAKRKNQLIEERKMYQRMLNVNDLNKKAAALVGAMSATSAYYMYQ